MGRDGEGEHFEHPVIRQVLGEKPGRLSDAVKLVTTRSSEIREAARLSDSARLSGSWSDSESSGNDVVSINLSRKTNYINS